MKKHFVTFVSPGSFFTEETTRDIGSWDPEVAMKMAGGITERYGARPFGFYFTTRERGFLDFDSKETQKSGVYYLGGVISTLEDVIARDDPDEKIMLNNMECNGWDRMIVNTNSYRACQPFRKDDCLLELPAGHPLLSKGKSDETD